MKSTMVFLLFAAVLVAVCALPSPRKVKLPPPRGGNPSFPGYGSFNPRGRRSPSPYDARIKVDQPVGKDPSVQVDINQKIYEGQHGHVEVYGSASKTPDTNSKAEAGIRGEVVFGNGRGGMSDDEIDRIRKEAKIN